MRLKTTLSALVMLLSISLNQETYEKINDIYQRLHSMNNVAIQGFNINLKEKKISYPSGDNLIYFYIKNDHNGKPLYSLVYTHKFDVQAYLQRLQRTP